VQEAAREAAAPRRQTERDGHPGDRRRPVRVLLGGQSRPDALTLRPRIPRASAAHAVGTTLEHRVGHEVVRRTIGDVDLDEVPGARQLGVELVREAGVDAALGAEGPEARREREMHEPVVRGSARDAPRLAVLAPLALRHEDLDRPARLGLVLLEADAVLELHEPLVALLDHGLG